MSNDHQITTADSEQTDLERSVIQLRQEGWCVVEDVIPSTSVESIRKEVEDSHLSQMIFHPIEARSLHYVA